MAVTPAIALLLVLDFSGSMDQALEQQPKILQLKNQARAVLSTLPAGESVRMVVFGANPAKGCQDFQVFKTTPAQSLATTLGMKPGPYGKTPLARTLRYMRDWSQDLKGSTALLFTDGADTCGEDPCQALLALDRDLGARRKKLNLVIVGYDLKNDAQKLECLKDPKTTNVQVKFFSAESSYDMQRAVSESLQTEAVHRLQQQGSEAGANASSARSAQPGSPGSNAAGGTSGGTGENKDQTGPAQLNVRGAEAADHFQIIVKGKVLREWYGGLPLDLPAGDYVIRYVNANGKSLPVSVKDRERHQFLLSDFFQRPRGDASFEEVSLGFELTPSDRTREVHGEPKPIFVQARLNGDRLEAKDIPIGTWTLKVVSPEWLKGRLPEQTLRITPDNSRIALDEKLRKELRWIDNDHAGRQRVLEITMGAGRVEAHLVPPGARRLPVRTEDRANWLQ
ncbi:MAG: VWA domain-containing protein [Bdellovibrionaceae bacterium]|nr:VWA domain-containing protein [Pseudobdellovibrionaceae bacterium]